MLLARRPKQGGRDVHRLNAAALCFLKNLLALMAHSGAFHPGEDTIGQELWEVKSISPFFNDTALDRRLGP